MKLTRISSKCSVFFIATTLLPLAGAEAETVDNFDTTSTPATSTQVLDGPGPTVTEGGPAGKFLRLIGGVNNQNNRYSYDLTDAGAFETITANFDFRITPGTNGLADGFGFLLVPTSAFGASGPGPDVLGEEPNVPNTFGVGFDVYQNINNVSAHFNGAQVTELAVPRDGTAVDFRGNGLFNNAKVELQRVGNGTNMRLTLTPDSLGAAPGAPYVAFETVIPNMLPYENRVQFNGRTGGENLTLDLDNVNVAYSNPFTATLDAAPSGRLYQDFDSTGATSYRAVQNAFRDATIFRPGPALVVPDDGSEGPFSGS